MRMSAKLRQLSILMCCLLLTSPLMAGQWMRTHESKDLKTTAEVRAEVFLLKDKQLTPCTKTPSIPVPLTFHPANDEREMLRLAPGEVDLLHVFFFYSTVDTDEGTFGTIVTVVAVPKKPHMPVLWKPRHLRKMNHMGLGEEDENVLQTLHKLKLGERSALPPLNNSENQDEPWKDYDLWIYKDYSQPYSLNIIEGAFASQANGSRVNFQVQFDEEERRPRGYKYPSTIDASSVTVEIAADSTTKVSFKDLAPIEDERILYELTVDRIKFYRWTHERTITGAYQSGDVQTISLGTALVANKDYRVRIKSRRSTFGDHDVQTVEKTFKSIPNSSVGADDDGQESDHPHFGGLRLELIE